jgi:hypothetical protein
VTSNSLSAKGARQVKDYRRFSIQDFLFAVGSKGVLCQRSVEGIVIEISHDEHANFRDAGLIRNHVQLVAQSLSGQDLLGFDLELPASSERPVVSNEEHDLPFLAAAFASGLAKTGQHEIVAHYQLHGVWTRDNTNRDFKVLAFLLSPG